MTCTKIIRDKIQSIKNTQKITKAMEMVAASKMRKTQEYMHASLPYAKAICKIIEHLKLGNLEYKHPYFNERIVQKIGYFVISTDRGLCGSLNSNLFKKLILDINNWKRQNVDINLAIIGLKGVSFFQFMKTNIVAQVTNITDNPNISKLIGLVKAMLQLYDEKSIDKLYIVHNKFVNTISQIPTITQLLPLQKVKFKTQKIQVKNKYWDYIYEPDPKYLLNILLNRYVEYQVYHSLLENLASEQSARMIAMKSATDNGNDLMNELQLFYNKARQASITQELIEIISGASVV